MMMKNFLKSSKEKMIHAGIVFLFFSSALLSSTGLIFCCLGK